jgi:hypothetical protein
MPPRSRSRTTHGVTVSPRDVKGANFSLIVFNDANGDGQLGSGEQFYLLKDPAYTFGDEPSRSLHLQYVDKAHTLRGQRQTSTGTPVHWDVTPAEGWGRTIYQLADGGSAVSVSYSNVLTGLNLQVGSSFTIQTLGSLEGDIGELLLFGR